jgi:pantoate--beta-alanine ligase
MRTITHIGKMQKLSEEFRREGKRIGFVPTMGFLHEGHLSLIDIARKNSDVTVASIFVNPTQFGPREDYSKYPRDVTRDKRLMSRRGCSILFYPEVKYMYGYQYKTEVYVRDLSSVLCGESRKTHFRGVTTVVTKLFHIVKPHVAVFGRKDAQQAIILKRMVEDLNFDVKILIGPTVREEDGLAMSSRNTYLSKKEREDAVVLFQSLQKAEKMVTDGERKTSKIVEVMRRMISSKRTARIDYVKIVEVEELKPVKKIRGEVLIAVACYFGKARLIDNTFVRGGR